MIIVEYNSTFKPQVRLSDIEVGTVFTGKIGTITGVFLKSFAATINLAKPHQTWDKTATLTEVHDYREVDIVIRVRDK